MPQFALTLHRGKAELLGNLGVLDLTSLLQRHALDSFRHVAARGDGRSTAEGLELDIRDDAVIVDSNLQLHDTKAISRPLGRDVCGTRWRDWT